MEPSFQEKSVWVQMIGLVVSFGAYAVMAGQLWSHGARELPAYVVAFVAGLVLLVLIVAAGHAAAALHRTPEPEDERDRLIELTAESRSSWVLGAGTFVAIAALVGQVPAFWVANLLLVAMYASEVLGLALRAVAYRRGA